MFRLYEKEDFRLYEKKPDDDFNRIVETSSLIND